MSLYPGLKCLYTQRGHRGHGCPWDGVTCFIVSGPASYMTWDGQQGSWLVSSNEGLGVFGAYSDELTPQLPPPLPGLTKDEEQPITESEEMTA